MREKELRLALVLTGGVSLAIYMHGVTRELLKLVRASKVYHSLQDHELRKQKSYADLNNDLSRETDTEEIYFDLIRKLAADTEIRVIIDVISGSSAGGVNGVMLARALAHDLPLDAHRDMWLEHADVLELMDDNTRANKWSKFYLEPFIRGPFSRYLKALAPDLETREKLITFLKSRWFRPPFSGKRFSGWMLDAAARMEQGRSEDASLMPDGHELELFVNVTDFQGHNRVVEIHDPQHAIETEHRVRLKFRYVRNPDGTEYSDFSEGMVPSLVFAARATSSFPGMFPPMTFQEMDEMLVQKKQNWEGREIFLKRNFTPLYKGGRDPENAFFIDGSTVNDKPFALAISSLSSRPAHREVVRRLLFIDPQADAGEKEQQMREPNMFRNLLGALIEIPRNEPIRDELQRLNNSNRKIRMLRQVIELSRPDVKRKVKRIISGREDAPTIQQISGWRRQAHTEVAEEGGIAYETYFRLKLLRVLSRIENLLVDLYEENRSENVRSRIRNIIKVWAGKNLHALGAGKKVRHAEDILFLKAFDIDFYIRRLRFVIRRLNEFYHEKNNEDAEERLIGLDEIKNALYVNLGNAGRYWDADSHSERIKEQAEKILESENSHNELDEFLSMLKGVIDLPSLDERADEIFSILTLNYASPVLSNELFISYIGFSFFDLLSFPLVQEEDLIELDEVLIHRISPKDARSLYRNNAPIPLKGFSLKNFGGFFNRGFREHDYLVGRLNAADRLVDMIMDVNEGLADKLQLDIEKIKKQLFRKILDSEVPFLTKDPDLIPALKKDIL